MKTTKKEPNPLVGQTVYITKYALTTGVSNGVICDVSVHEDHTYVMLKDDQHGFYCLGIVAFVSKDLAWTKAEQMRLNKIKSVAKQLDKLNKMEFKF